MTVLIGLTGKAGSGKDSVAKVLIEEYGFVRLAFADKVRQLALKIDPIVNTRWGYASRLSSLVGDYGWDEAKKEPEMRKFLQDLGAGCREIFGELCWIDLALDSFPHEAPYVVITDVRYLNEANIIRAAGGWVFRVTRPTTGPEEDWARHASETEQDRIVADVVIENDSDLFALRLKVNEAMRLVGVSPRPVF